MSTFVNDLPVRVGGAGSAVTSVVDSSGNLNVSLLKTEIKSDLASDATYKAVDAMKKKAIHTAQSYDEFKNFVACAEQKPLDRGEMESLKQQKGSWSQQKTRSELSKKRSKKLSKKNANLKLSLSFPTSPPDTSMKFDRDYRRHCPTLPLKLRYLSLCTSSICPKIWSTEIDVSILGSIIDTLVHCILEGGERDFVVGWMKGLKGCGRFKLNVCFLDDGQVKGVEKIVEFIVEGGGEYVDIAKELREEFK
ncbi:hypothetical protein TrVE_jg2157 [Triparma verrucosa]|uniref:Dynein attachment factor N-terminal domain-containing protein n=1 Tax=Triparma verrucosa TaxID=1606542 RepID=A0A9W7B1Z5_9STRA|nr:hypothetical protein TrVE_jg2157 [Triparma verrucosa]